MSTYLITYSAQLYERQEPLLGVFERRAPSAEPQMPHGLAPDVIVIGMGRFGREIVAELLEQGLDVLGVDFDPQRAERMSARIEVVYGDAEDPELPAALPLHHAPWVVSAVRTVDANVAVVRHLRDSGYGGSIAVVSHTDAETERLTEAGADLTINLFQTGAQPIISRVTTTVRSRSTD